MKPYLTLEIATLVLVLLGIAYFYTDLISGNFSWFAASYFLILALGYFFVFNRITNRSKEYIKEAVGKMGCEFLDNGAFSLTHRIECDDGDMVLSMRGSYVPSSLYIRLNGDFKPFDLEGSDELSRRISVKLLKLERKYGVRINDAHSSGEELEMIISRLPYKFEGLSDFIEELKSIVRE